ncbi:GspH/FimT family pseudopilin [Pseudoduganella sp.]|uniref:GspH/FimT family pseudopilin n=1 Tax=Pseudoduganella sp. TaxID=1880898 RepID=UPI0035B292B7
MLRRRQQGVSLIELMVGISIVAFLLAAGMPSFTRWLQDAQNRAAAESLLNGLQLARMESLRRNAQVNFTLTDKDGKVAWTVGCKAPHADCPAAIQSRSAREAGEGPRLGVNKDVLAPPIPPGTFDAALEPGSGLLASVTFDSLGRAPGAGNGKDITRIDVTNPRQANARRYVVTINVGGQVRMCDPALALAKDPQGCS